MMIEPPIDKLIKKAECRYALVMGVANRAKQLVTQEADYWKIHTKNQSALLQKKFTKAKS